MSTPREQLAELLATSRTEAGYDSQSAFAKALHISRPVVSKAENPVCPIPSTALLTSWSGMTGVPLDKLTDLAKRCRSGTPEWFVSYRQAEGEATMLRSWGSDICPGLTQTESYARCVLSAQPFTPDALAELLQARIERQGVLSRAFYVVIIAAEVLARNMGGPAVMAEQCAHLARLAELPNVTLHVVPADTNHGSWAGFDMASRDGLTTVSFTTGTDDVSTNSTDRADKALQTFERILGLALTPVDSLAFVRTQEEMWKSQI